MPKRIDMLAPRGTCKNGHWVYAIGFADQTVKIGVSKDIRVRLKHHRQTYGESIRWVHLFTSSKNAKWIEASVCRAMESDGKRFGKTEHFAGIGKADFIALVRRHAVRVEAQFAEMEARGRAHREWQQFYEKHLALARAEYNARKGLGADGAPAVPTAETTEKAA